MRRALLAAAILSSFPAFAVTTRQWVEAQSATRATPSAAPTTIADAFPLSDVTRVRVIVKATSGTITKGCTLRAWLYVSGIGWMRAAVTDSTGTRSADKVLYSNHVGETSVVFPGDTVDVPTGWLLYATDGCDALTVYIQGVTQ